MSGSGGGQKACFCYVSRCLNGNCGCFKANLPCTGDCCCHACGNNKNNQVEVELRHNAYLKMKSLRPEATGCRCKESGCVHMNCSCFRQKRRCTAKCKCQDCTNRKGLGGGDANTEQGQGSKDPTKQCMPHHLGTTGAPDRTNDHGTSCD